MKKLAICISGIPRYSYCVETIKKIAQHNEVVVFIWFWNHESSGDISTHSWRKSNSDPAFSPEIFRLPNIELFYESGSFSDMKAHFQEQWNVLPYPKREDLGVYSMFYAMMKVNNMRERYEAERKIEFDCVMRARFELSFNRPGSMGYNANSVFKVDDFDQNCLWHSHTNLHPTYGIGDCLGFSNSKNMSNYMSAYNRIQKLSLIEGHNPELITYHNNIHIAHNYQFVLLGL